MEVTQTLGIGTKYYKHIIKLEDGRNVNYENDYGETNGQGYALVYKDNFDGYERYEIGSKIEGDLTTYFPDFTKPLNYRHGSNRTR